MSGLRFERPIGAAADVKELEYIIALHQTCTDGRANATISSHDIVALLKSRYGLTISHEEALSVVKCFGGGDSLVEDETKQSAPQHVAQKVIGIVKTVSNDAKDKIRAWHHRNDSRGGEKESHDHSPEGRREDTQTYQWSDPSRFQSNSSLSSSDMSGMLNRLDELHGAKQQGLCDERKMTTLRDKVVANLRKTVIHRTNLKLAQRSGASFQRTSQEMDREVGNKNDDDKSVESMEIEFDNLKTTTTATLAKQSILEENVVEVDDRRHVDRTMSASSCVVDYDDDGVANFASYEFSPAQDNQELTLQEEVELQEFFHKVANEENNDEQLDEIPNLAQVSSVTHSTESPNSSINSSNNFENSQRAVSHITGYLDLLQVLSTILIPFFARIAHDGPAGKTNASRHQKKESKGCLGTLYEKCLAFGRRKLNITNDNRPNPCEANQILEDIRLALLKTVVLTDDNYQAEDGDYVNMRSKNKKIAAPVVDEALIQLLLVSHGEMERANEKELVRDMAIAASSPSGVFDQDALINALTSDVVPTWDPTCDNTAKTFLFDVLGEAFPGVETRLRLGENEKNGGNVKKNFIEKSVRDIESLVDETSDALKPTSSSFLSRCFNEATKDKGDFSFLFGGVDLVTDSAASLIIMILIWLSFVFFLLIYGTVILSLDGLNVNCDLSGWWCLIVGKLYNWLVISAILLTCGIALVVPLSIGNNPSGISPGRMAFSMVYALSNTLVPFFVINWLERRQGKIASGDELLEDQVESAEKALLATGCLLAFLFACHGIFILFIGHNKAHHLSPFLRAIFAATSYNGEVRSFRALQFKVDRIIANALSLHEFEKIQSPVTWSQKVSLSSESDVVMRNYICRGERYEEVGGVFYCLWRLIDGSLLDEEGIWLHTRLLVIQVAQIGIAMFTTVLLFLLQAQLGIGADDLRATLDPFNLPDWIMEIFPTGEMVHTALSPAGFIAMVFMAIIISLYIPSSIATILKFRAGILPSLGSVYFQKYRTDLDMTYVNTANALYGLISMALLFYLVCGFIIFLFVWPISQSRMFFLCTSMAGISITVAIKILITKALKKQHYRRMYRIRPAAARLTSLALECWQLGLASSIALVRISQYLVASLFWVGRIDTPFLSEDAVIMGYQFDIIPKYYIQDLLQHDAHRHPYIERLAQMYMMKIRHGESFVTNAGSAWRQLAVRAVFPWLQKYRVFRDERRFHGGIEITDLMETEKKENGSYAGFNEMTSALARTGEAITEVKEELTNVKKEVKAGFQVGKQRATAVMADGLRTIHISSGNASPKDDKEVSYEPPYGLNPSWN